MSRGKRAGPSSPWRSPAKASAGRPGHDSEARLAEALVHHQAGRLQAAEGIYRGILDADPDHPGSLRLLGVLVLQIGRFADAAKLIERSLALDPDDADAMNNLGQAYVGLGRLEDAVGCYRKAIARRPGFAAALSNLGNTLQETGDLDGAVESYRLAHTGNPGDPEILSNLGGALLAVGKMDEAMRHLRRACEIDPGNSTVLFNLGNAHRAGDRLEEAAECYRWAAAVDPDDPDILVNLGSALLATGRREDAVHHLERAVVVHPGFADAHFNLGLAYQSLGRRNDAMNSFRRATEADPGHVKAHLVLGREFMNLRRTNEAAALFEHAIASSAGAIERACAQAGQTDAIGDDLAELLANAGKVYWLQARAEDAKKALAKAVALKPDKVGWRILLALILPVIPKSNEEIADCRRALAAAIQSFRNQHIKLADPLAEVGTTNFNLAYHGLPDLNLQRALAVMYLDAYPDLAWTAPHCRRKQTKRGRLRIGVVSAFMHRSHTIGKLNRGLLENLSRERFEVVLFRPRPFASEIEDSLDEDADRAIDLPPSLEAARQAIAAEKPDFLFYPDIGMVPITYFLAFARLAPVQMTSWGHPDTTGIPNLDYFLSPAAAEPADADAHYSERLVRFNDIVTCYRRPVPPDSPPDRRALGLPVAERLYVCPQSLFKFHPDFDPVLGDILARDPNGTLVLVDSAVGSRQRSLIEARFRRAFPTAAGRVIFLPSMTMEKYLGLLMAADAVLDLPTFSGGNSSLEAFAMGVPVVTWPSNFMRGRVTLACYRQMGIDDLVADSAETYVSIAFRLANDAAFRAVVKRKIAERADRLFENLDFVREFEDFVEAAVAARQRREPPIRWPAG